MAGFADFLGAFGGMVPGAPPSTMGMNWLNWWAGRPHVPTGEGTRAAERVEAGIPTSPPVPRQVQGTGLGTTLATVGAPQKQPPRTQPSKAVTPAPPGNPPHETTATPTGEGTRARDRQAYEEAGTEAPTQAGIVPQVGSTQPAQVTAANTPESILQNIGFTKDIQDAFGLNKDWTAEAQKLLGRGPEAPPNPEETYKNPWVQAAILAPAAIGALSGGGLTGFAGSAAALEGLVGGQAAQKLLYEQGLGAYQDRLGKLREQMEAQGTRAFQALAPGIMAKRAEDLRWKAQLMHYDYQQKAQDWRQLVDTWRHDTTIQGLADRREFQQGMLAERQIMDRVTEALDRVKEATMLGRYDIAAQTERDLVGYRHDLINIAKQRVGIAQELAKDPLKNGAALAAIYRVLDTDLYNSSVFPGGEQYPGEISGLRANIDGLRGILTEMAQQKEVQLHTGGSPRVQGPNGQWFYRDPASGQRYPILHNPKTGEEIYQGSDGQYYVVPKPETTP